MEWKQTGQLSLINGHKVIEELDDSQLHQLAKNRIHLTPRLQQQT